MNYRIISADDHIDLQWLPKDLWQKRVPAEWRERAPKVVDTPDGPYWVCSGDRWDPWGGRKGAAGAQGGRRTALEKGGVLEPGVLRPTTTALRLADMDRDSVDATVMYGPIVPLLIADPELRRVCYRAYNEWLAEFCATASDRLVGAGLIPIDDAKSAADEVRHLKQLRLRTGMFLAARVDVPLWDESWEPLWEAAAETGIVIGFHLGGGLRTVTFSGPKASDPGNMGVRVACSTLQMDEPLAAVIFSGALERHPRLRIVLAETGIGWLPYMVERMDDSYQRFLDAGDFWPAADDGAQRVFPAPGVGHVPDRSRRAASHRRARRRPRHVGVGLPARGQHLAGIAEGDRGELQGRGGPRAAPHPVRQCARAVRPVILR